MTDKLPMSAMILTKDEALNLPTCLKSLCFVDEIVVIDSGSTDCTLDIAAQYTDKIVHHPFETFAQQRNWALDTLPWKYDWILMIDADEWVPPELADEIAEVIHNPNYAAYYVNRRYIFLGRWMKHGGKYPMWDIRLYRRSTGRFEERASHPHFLAEGRVGYLKSDMIHDDQRSLFDFFDRHNRYSTADAQEFLAVKRKQVKEGIRPSFWGNPVERRRAIKERVWPYLPFKPVLLFLYQYVLKLGFLDGKPGFIFCLLMAIHVFQTDVKQYEFEKFPTRLPDGIRLSK